MPCGWQGVGATSRHRNRKAGLQQLHCKRRKSANKLHKNTHHRDLLSIHCVRRNTCQGDLLIESHFLTCFSQCRSLLNSLSSLLQHWLGFTLWLFGSKTWESLAPRPEIEPASPAPEGKILTPGPPRKSQRDLLKWKPYFSGVSNGPPTAYRIKLHLSTWNSQPSFTCPSYMSTILVLEASPNIHKPSVSKTSDHHLFSNPRTIPFSSAGHHVASRHCLCVNACLPSRFSCFRLFATLRTIALQAPLSLGCSRQEHWSGFSFPPLRDLPDPGLEPVSLTSPVWSGGFFTASNTWTSGPSPSWQSALSFLR